MNFMEAVKAMKEGNRVQRGNWKNSYLIDKEGTIHTHLRLNGILVEDVEATDWEIYEEVSLRSIQEGIDAFRENNTAIPNRIRLHSKNIEKLHLEDSVIEIFGLKIETDDFLNETEAIVYYEEEPEFKTLKDFDGHDGYGEPCKSKNMTDEDHINRGELKAEAIKWIQEDIEEGDKNDVVNLIIKWRKRFNLIIDEASNITEDDLQLNKPGGKNNG